MAGNEHVAAEQPEWELSKENFQPLKAGRKPGGLHDATAESKKAPVDEQRQIYLDEIAKYNGDDPLEVWLRFIKWTQDTFKAGGHKAELLPLLERCTRELQGVERYRTDIRYLRVWIQYADCLPDPGDVFSFLKDHDVGQSHALFYIAYATYLELRGSYSAADNVYQQGINRLAAPHDRLRAKFTEFQHRMARRIQRKAQEQGAGAEEADGLERPYLALLGGQRGGRTTGGLGPQKRKAVATPGRDNAPAGGGLHIFVDDQFGGPAVSAPPVLTAAIQPCSIMGARPSLSHLPSFDAVRKENTQKAASWAGQRIKQAQAHSAPAAAPLNIPMDPEFEAEQAEKEARRRAAEAAPHTSLRQRLERGGRGVSAWSAAALEEELASDPLRLHKTASTARPGPTDARRDDVLGCDAAALQGSDGEEQSFEELRGRRLLQSRAQPAPQAEPVEASLPQQLDSFDQPQLMQEDSLAPVPAVEPSPTAAQAEPLMDPAPILLAADEHPPTSGSGADMQPKPTPFDQTAAAASQDATVAASRGGHVSKAAEEALAALTMALQQAASSSDVTISTRSAFEAVNAMFGQHLPSADSAALTAGSAEDPALEPTMTISTRDAFAAINGMFGGSLAPGVPSTSDPTLTLSTKAAFDALNAMFAASSGGRSSAAAPAPAPAAPGSPEEGALYVRQDTGLSTGPLAGDNDGASNASEEGLDIREDTVFISRPAAPFTAERQQQQQGLDALDLDIREDTVFIARHPAAALGASRCGSPELIGLGIREDTVFINPRPAAAAQHMPSPFVLSIRDDAKLTVLAVPAAGAVEERDDTADLLADAGTGSPLAEGAGFAGKWGFAPGADDTLDFGGDFDGITEALSAPLHSAPQPSTGLTQDFGALGLAAGALASMEADHDEVAQPSRPNSADAAMHSNENLPPGDAAVAPRDLRDAAVSTLVLQPLGQPRCSRLGVEVEESPEAEAALAAAPWDQEGPDGNSPAGSPLQDEFEVYTDGVEEGGDPTQPALASPDRPQCINPFAAGFQQYMLSMLDPPVGDWPGVGTVTAAEEGAAVATFNAARRGTPTSLQLGGGTFHVQRCIGAGAYATVYQATSADVDVALKLEAPPCPWEWYVCRAVQGRVPAAMRPAFMDPTALLLGAETSVLVMPRGHHGSLQDLLNLFLRRGQRPEEALVMHLAASLLHTMGALHAARILHNDVKPDNLLVTLAASCDENAAPAVGLQLIDFGRGVDLELLPPSARLQGDCGTDAFRCVEMREGEEWVWQADAYGAAGCTHCLLFGEYMKVERVVEGATGAAFLRIKAPLRRYWTGDIWREFFSVLLNHSDAAVPPPWAELAARFEAHLSATREAQRTLRSELAKLAAELAAQC